MLIMDLRYEEPSCAGMRTNRITVRLTDPELDWLKEASWESKMSQAEFIRSKVFGSKVSQVPQEVKDMFHRLDLSMGKIGNNVNQIARSANASGYISAASIRKLYSLMEDLNDICRRMYEDVMEVYSHGDHEAFPD